jgi:hypothetical protein
VVLGAGVLRGLGPLFVLVIRYEGEPPRTSGAGNLVSENALAAILRRAGIRRNTQRTSFRPGPIGLCDRSYAELLRTLNAGGSVSESICCQKQGFRCKGFSEPRSPGPRVRCSRRREGLYGSGVNMNPRDFRKAVLLDMFFSWRS